MVDSALPALDPEREIITSIPHRVWRWPRLTAEQKRKAAGIPRTLYDFSLETYPFRTELADLVEYCEEWVDAWPVCTDARAKPEFDDLYEHAKGMLMLGPPGRGKTTLAVAVANDVMDKGWKVAYLPVSDWYQAHLEVMRYTEGQTDSRYLGHNLQEELDALATEVYDLVVLDDMGKEHRTKSGFSENLIDSFVRRRFANALPTIITSNVGENDFGKVYNPSMGSFINEAYAHLLFPEHADDDHRRDAVRRIGLREGRRAGRGHR